MRYILYNLAMIAAATAMLISCSEKPLDPGRQADIIVFGNVHTMENGMVAKAFAVKDGKYIYIGSVDGVQGYKGSGTTVYDFQKEGGMILPSCTDGHAHRLKESLQKNMGMPLFEMTSTKEEILQRLSEAVKEPDSSGNPKEWLYAFGWNVDILSLTGMLTAEDLDGVSGDIPIYVADDEGHKGIANTLCLKNAGVLNEDGSLNLEKIPQPYTINGNLVEIRGGFFEVDGDMHPTGYMGESAATYVRRNGLNSAITIEDAQAAIRRAQSRLNEMGYTAVIDGWTNFFDETFYEAACLLDKEGGFTINMGASYEIEPCGMDIDTELNKAADKMKYKSDHFHPKYVKMFADGTPDSRTGYVSWPYIGDDGEDAGCGIPNWTDEEWKDITAKANKLGLTLHAHALGDKAISQCVDAFAAARQGGASQRNQIVHLYYVNPDTDDYKTIAENDIPCSVGILWHMQLDEQRMLRRFKFTGPYLDHLYPMKSFLDHGIRMSTSTDSPATSGSPEEPFGIMEIACTATAPWLNAINPINEEECITREQALEVLTINGAYQMGLEDERGSIKIGKYADFILIDENVLECNSFDIHKAKVLATFFEGKQVYSAR